MEICCVCGKRGAGQQRGWHNPARCGPVTPGTLPGPSSMAPPQVPPVTASSLPMASMGAPNLQLMEGCLEICTCIITVCSIVVYLLCC